MSNIMSAIEASITRSMDPQAAMQDAFMGSILDERKDARMSRKATQIMEINEKLKEAKANGADESTLRALRSCLAHFEQS